VTFLLYTAVHRTATPNEKRFSLNVSLLFIFFSKNVLELVSIISLLRILYNFASFNAMTISGKKSLKTIVKSLQMNNVKEIQISTGVVCQGFTT
jgi:hypothetical protein